MIIKKIIKLITYKRSQSLTEVQLFFLTGFVKIKNSFSPRNGSTADKYIMIHV